MTGTARYNMPFLSAGQAQKEITVNEALQSLDLIVSAAVEQDALSDPPASPTVGTCYLVGASPSGDWAGKPQTVAGYTSGGWRFIEPVEGLSVYVKSSGQVATYRSGAWEFGILRAVSVQVDGQQVVGSRAAAIVPPTGGTLIDIEARSTIEIILGALRHHGLIES